MRNRPLCPRPACPSHTAPKRLLPRRRGAFLRQHDQRWIHMFYCPQCRRSFSTAVFEPTYRQRKPEINDSIRCLLSSGVSERRIAKILGVHPRTVARRIDFLSAQAHKTHLMELSRTPPVTDVVTDEMESFEHTRCKPVSIPLVVEKATRRILEIDVSSMPPKGNLAKTALAKYGPRPDERRVVMERMMKRASAFLSPNVSVLSDMCPRYAPMIKAALPKASHTMKRSRRAVIAGYGELKEGGNDPMFSLNHTAAMIRDNLKCLARRTWCTVKRMSRLLLRLWIYVDFHNKVLVPRKPLPILAARSP